MWMDVAAGGIPYVVCESKRRLSYVGGGIFADVDALHAIAGTVSDVNESHLYPLKMVS